MPVNSIFVFLVLKTVCLLDKNQYSTSKENKYYNSLVICLTVEGNIYFYKATAYGIVPVPKSVQQQSVQFTTWSCSSSHACDHHVQGVHELVYAEIQDYVTTPKSNWAPQEQCCELSALPIPLQLQVLDLQEPGQSFPSLRYNKPGAYTEIVGLEAHTKNVPVGVCDH